MFGKCKFLFGLMIEFILNILCNKNVIKFLNRFKILVGKKYEIYKINGS